jgi:putative membrane protein
MTTLTRVLLIAALSAPLSVSAQTTPTAPTKTGGATGATKATTGTGTTKTDAAKKEKLSDADLQLIAHYHAENLMEIDLGKLAAKRGTTPAVKQYGDMLVKDHGDFDKKLAALAKKMGQAIPAEKPDPAKKDEMAAMKKRAADLQKLTGANFDREYLSFMVDAHQHAVTAIDADMAAAKNEELATMLREVKPVLQTHHDKAADAQKATPPGK